MSLISNLDSQAGKTAYQTYTIRHGIETIEAIVPLSEATAFEQELSTANLKTRQSVIQVITDFGGQLK